MLFHTNRDLADEHVYRYRSFDLYTDQYGYVHTDPHDYTVAVYPFSSDQYTEHHFYQHGDAGTGDRADQPADDDGGTRRPAHPGDG